MNDERFAPECVEAEQRADGTRLFRSTLRLGAFARSVADDLARWAALAPERAFVVEPERGGARRTLAFGAAYERARAVARGLLTRGFDGPLIIATPNGIDHAIAALGALVAGIPYAPLPPPLARDPAREARFAECAARLGASLAFVDDEVAAERLRRALPHLDVVVSPRDLECTRVPSRDDPVDAAASRVTLDSVAKILFTSGSTGVPKGVVTTHRMLASNQAALDTIWPLSGAPPILCDWLPWSHSFGGNKVFGFALHRGGTLYVDDGAPTPQRFARTLELLRDVAPTAYFGVPHSFGLLARALAEDAAFARHFFSQLDLLFAAAAPVPPDLRVALGALWTRAVPRAPAVLTGWGATETAPMATCVHALDASPLTIGVPIPGTEIKLAPLDGRFELRVRGPNVMPGYWRDDAATRASFDEDGFYRTGDAGALVDEARPMRGFAFRGRLVENFKLATGTWVDAHALRSAFVAAAAPLVADAVIVAADDATVGALVYLDVAVARATASGRADDAAALARDPNVREALQRALVACAAARPTPSGHIARAIVVEDEPAFATGERTEKGTIAREVALRLRAADVARLSGPDALRAEPVSRP
jgi:feruloyl-CoA synthase